MSSKINIETNSKYTNISLEGNVKEIDIVLAIGALFDRLHTETKRILIPKLKNIAELEKAVRSEKQCPCMKEPSLNCGMKCSRCGREL